MYNRFDGAHWQPHLSSVLVSILILAGCVLQYVLKKNLSAMRGHANSPGQRCELFCGFEKPLRS
jgi:hypothetical protein